MGSLMHARRTITPNGRFDLFAAPGFDPNLPDDVCKHYGSLLIIKRPVVRACWRAAILPKVPFAISEGRRLFRRSERFDDPLSMFSDSVRNADCLR